MKDLWPTLCAVINKQTWRTSLWNFFSRLFWGQRLNLTTDLPLAWKSTTKKEKCLLSFKTRRNRSLKCSANIQEGLMIYCSAMWWDTWFLGHFFYCPAFGGFTMSCMTSSSRSQNVWMKQGRTSPKHGMEYEGPWQEDALAVNTLVSR